MSCQYKDQCPSYSGWCNGPKQDFSKCVEFLITAYENEKKRMMPNEYQKLAIRTCSSRLEHGNGHADQHREAQGPISGGLRCRAQSASQSK